MSGGVPHFVVRTIGGGVADYAAAIWQRRNLVLAVLPMSDAADRYAASLGIRAADFTSLRAALVITRDAVPGMSAPSVLVADEWGEIAFTASMAHVHELPDPGELLEWLEHVQQRCPECEGEAR